MADKKEKTEAYKLKDPSTTFYDPETKLKVVGDKETEIPVSGRGKLTLAAINAGGLISVDSSAAEKAAAAKDKATGGKKD